MCLCWSAPKQHVPTMRSAGREVTYEGGVLSPSQLPRQPLRRLDDIDNAVFSGSAMGFSCDISFGTPLLNDPHTSLFAASLRDAAACRSLCEPAALLIGVWRAERRENKRLLSPPDATPSSRASEAHAVPVFCAASGLFRAAQGSTWGATRVVVRDPLKENQCPFDATPA